MIEPSASQTTNDQVLDISKSIGDTGKNKVGEQKIELQNKVGEKKEGISTGVELSHDFIKENKDDPNFWVIYPVFKTFNLPGVNDKDQKDFLVEDESKAPDSSLYFKIGYILKAESNSRPEASTKHYRRIYREPLERCPDVKIKSPFLKSQLKRGKFEDKKSEMLLFDTMGDINSKIMKRFLFGQKREEALKEVKQPSVHSSRKSSEQSVGFLGSSEEKVYGNFKGFIRIAEKEKMEEFEKSVKECLSKNSNIANEYKN